MTKFSLKTWGFSFFVVDVTLALLVFILCVAPGGSVCSGGICESITSMHENSMAFPLAISIFALIINIIWAVLQKLPSCNWSAYVYASETKETRSDDTVITESVRVVVPRWGPTIGFAVFYFIAGIVAGYYSRNCLTCAKRDAFVGTWAAVSVFSFVACIVYGAETFCIFKRQAEFDGQQ